MYNANYIIFRYESHDALHGGKDGMDVVRKILNIAAEQLKAKG